MKLSWSFKFKLKVQGPDSFNLNPELSVTRWVVLGLGLRLSLSQLLADLPNLRNARSAATRVQGSGFRVPQSPLNDNHNDNMVNNSNNNIIPNSEGFLV